MMGNPPGLQDGAAHEKNTAIFTWDGIPSGTFEATD
jgi:hypothetical protein